MCGMEISGIAGVTVVNDRVNSPLAHGIRSACAMSGWSLWDLAHRCQLEPSAFEQGYVGTATLDKIVELTDISLLNIRRMGLGLTPISPLSSAD